MKYAILFALLSLPAFAVGGTCPAGSNYVNLANPSGSFVTLASKGVTSCFFISKALGSDANAGTTEASPFQHVPGMHSWTGSGTICNSHACDGVGFILRGGDSWTNADMELGWWGTSFANWSGSSGAPVYIGVDLSWFSGGSWTRPIFTCGGSICSETANGDGFYKDTSSTQWVELDDIEFTGLHQDATHSEGYVKIFGNHTNVTRAYFHGWDHIGCGAGCPDQETAFSPSTCCGGGIDDNIYLFVIDGADTSGADMLNAITGTPNIVAYGYINDVSNGVEGAQNQVHDVWFSGMVPSFSTGAHQNAIQQTSLSSGTNGFFYNNVITTVQSGGITKLWLGQNGSCGAGCTTYAFDNVLFNNSAGNDVNPAQLAGNAGTFYYFSNTFECGSVSGGVGDCMAGSGLPTTQTVNWIDNHCIATSCVNVSGNANFTLNLTTNLTQSIATASGQGYTEGSTYAFAPTSGAGGTVGTGANKQTLVATITALDATAGAAAGKDTGYSCSYSSSVHTVSCPQRAPLARPSVAAWDIGAYQFSGASQASPSSCSPGAGSYSGTQTPACTNPNTGTTVQCYTTNGATPATNGSGTACTTGTLLSSGSTVTISTTTTLNIIAGTSTLADSTVTTYVYTINVPVSAPSINMISGNLRIFGQGRVR